MQPETIWLSEADVVGLLALDEAIDALGAALSAPDAAHANVPKALGRWREGAAIQALGAMLPSAGVVGWKSWAITPVGGAVLYGLFDAEDGRLLAAMEGVALGQLRTAAISGLATRLLARPHASVLGIAGTGRQALAQVAAVAAVRPLTKVLCYSPTEAHRIAFAEKVATSLGLQSQSVDSPAAMAEEADIVTLVTRAKVPFLDDSMVKPGTHINAVGAIMPEFAEFEASLLSRAFAVVDSLPDVQRNSSEFREFYGDDWSKVRSIAAVAAGNAPPAHDCTIFKAMGMGLSDLAVAKTIYDRAVAGGIGRPLDAGARASIRFASRQGASK